MKQKPENPEAEVAGDYCEVKTRYEITWCPPAGHDSSGRRQHTSSQPVGGENPLAGLGTRKNPNIS